MTELLRQERRPGLCLPYVLAMVVAPFLSYAENGPSDLAQEVTQVAKALNQAHTEWAAGYSDTSFSFGHIEYAKGQQAADRLFEMRGMGLKKFEGTEAYAFKRFCRLVQDGTRFSYYITEARNFDGKGNAYRNSLWKSDGEYLRVLQYPIGKPISSLLAMEPLSPASDNTAELAKSRTKRPPDGKDTPWGIVKSALGFSAERSPDEVFIVDDIAKIVANATLIPAGDGRYRVLKIDDGTSTQSIRIDSDTHLPVAVDILDRNGALNIRIEISYYRPEELHASTPFPKKIVWKSFIVDGGQKLPLLDKVIEVGSVKFGVKAAPSEFDIDSLTTPMKALRELVAE